MNLADFLNKHKGETVWLFGKGPSLSGFDFSKAGPLRAAINDVIGHIPGCLYGFANDGVERWADFYSDGQILFQPKRCLCEFDSTKPGAVNCKVVTYDDRHNDIRRSFTKEEIAELPFIRRGTLGSAIQIFYVMGFSEVVCVGIDGGGQHAQGYNWRTDLRRTHAEDYNAIRSAAIDAAGIMGIKLTFYGKDDKMEPSGKQYVRFLRNALAQSQHYCQGEIEAFCPQIVGELISCGAAERFVLPMKEDEPVIESAIDPLSARELAMIPVLKRGKKSKQ